MMIQVEFYRMRLEDDARALVGRVTYEAIDAQAAVVAAKSLFRTLDLPQKPDAMRIVDAVGNKLFDGRYATEQ